MSPRLTEAIDVGVLQPPAPDRGGGPSKEGATHTDGEAVRFRLPTRHTNPGVFFHLKIHNLVRVGCLTVRRSTRRQEP